ncbi:MAG: hypothetical protein KC589_02735 [Nanoarchaeota archaeon]|nr:hypothetical protein [Nanoarchaeota archaeon]
MKRIEIFKKTKDNWYDNYYLKNFPIEENKLVNIVFLQMCCSQPLWYISIHGNNDYEYKRIFDNELEATEIFLEILQQEYISKEFVETLDFNLIDI